MKDTGKILLALLAGAAAGAALGILFAPEKGSETRRKIIDGVDDFTEDMKTRVSDIKEKVTDKFNQMSGSDSGSSTATTGSSVGSAAGAGSGNTLRSNI